MPQLTRSEQDALNKFSNRVYDFLFQDLSLNEKRADEIATNVIALIRKEAESK